MSQGSINLTDEAFASQRMTALSPITSNRGMHALQSKRAGIETNSHLVGNPSFGGLLPACPSLGNNRRGAKAEHIAGCNYAGVILVIAVARCWHAERPLASVRPVSSILL
jgi:hypothetical protein